MKVRIKRIFIRNYFYDYFFLEQNDEYPRSVSNDEFNLTGHTIKDDNNEE